MTGLEILAAFAPALSTAVQAAARHFFGSAGRPKSMQPAEWIEMMKADTERLKVLASLDGEGAPAGVQVIRALVRPVTATAVTAAYIWAQLSPDIDAKGLESAAASVWFYLFGERTLIRIKGV